MDKKARWNHAATELWVDANRLSESYVPSLKGSMTLILGNMVKSVDHGFEDWGDAERAEVSRRFLGRPGYDADDRYLVAYRCLKIAHFKVSGRLQELSVAERRMVEVYPEERAVETPSPDGDSFPVDFAFRFAAPAPGKRVLAYASGSGTTTVRRLDPSGFEGCVLPGPSGPVRVLRDGEGRWFRPIFAPGSWTPLTDARFVEACDGTSPWRDDPFADPEHVKRVPVAHAEYGSDRELDGRSAGPHAEALRQSQVRAGALASIGGVVHVRIPEPTLHVVARRCYTSYEKFGVGWRAGNLTSEVDMAAIPALPFRPEEWSWRLRDPENWGKADGLQVDLAFPPSCLRAVERLATLAGEATGVRVVLYDEGVAGPEPVDVDKVALRLLDEAFTKVGEGRRPEGRELAKRVAAIFAEGRGMRKAERDDFYRKHGFEEERAPQFRCHVDLSLGVMTALAKLAEEAMDGAYDDLKAPAAEDLDVDAFMSL